MNIIKLMVNRYSCALFLIILASCNDAKKTKTETDAPVQETVQGEKLIANSNCLSCHKPSVKLIGPSFHEIAEKYTATADNYKMLTEKIIKGGTGNWGTVLMSPHPEVSEADAKKMIDYILNGKQQE